ncbi:guanine deaminase-like isoform X1 [Ptychodera flava]|uniref:guanine deaminase-like isoform X1 n=1 Tax=Ptychodera flava TaxID=63121 RepID=UPI00396A38A6
MSCRESDETSRIFRGTFVHATAKEPLEICEDRILGVTDGKIQFIGGADELSSLCTEYNFIAEDVQQLNEGQFLIPGFVDTHFHAPQYPYTGTGMDLQLLGWLEKYAFPVESKYADADFAKRMYDKAVRHSLKWGTTTASYFATIHTEATLELAKVAAKRGQRAFVGKVNMDQNSPKFYIESTEESLRETERFIAELKKLNLPRITPVITPRFSPSCTVELLEGLGKLAKRYDLPIQSHMSESAEECELAVSLFPDYKNDTEVHDRSGLLTDKTYMAHCLCLSDEEIDIVRQRGCGIAHCPSSNTAVRSGMFDVRKMLNAKVKIGLGTDVAGGYQPSILDAIRQAIIVSKLLSLNKPSDYQSIEYREAFMLATLGGSQVLGLDDKIGNFEVGKEFDALLIDVCCEDSPFDVINDLYTDNIEDKVQKFLYLGDDRNIKEVYVCGERVKEPKT